MTTAPESLELLVGDADEDVSEDEEEGEEAVAEAPEAPEEVAGQVG